VTCIGQLIGLTVAKTRPLAQRAAKLVKVTYKDLPAIITIEVDGQNFASNLIYHVNRRLLLLNHIINQSSPSVVVTQWQRLPMLIMFCQEKLELVDK